MVESSRKSGPRAKENVIETDIDGPHVEIEDHRRNENPEDTSHRARVVERFSGVEPSIYDRRLGSLRPSRTSNAQARPSRVQWEPDRDRPHGELLSGNDSMRQNLSG